MTRTESIDMKTVMDMMTPPLMVLQGRISAIRTATQTAIQTTTLQVWTTARTATNLANEMGAYSGVEDEDANDTG